MQPEDETLSEGKLRQDFLELIYKSGIIKLGETCSILGLSKKIGWEWAVELKREGLIDVKTHLLKDTELVRKNEVHVPNFGQSTVIAVSNQKGGVGKTITSMNLAACLALAGKNTLIVDLDPQANTTSGIGFDKHSIRYSIYDGIINDRPLDDILLPTGLEKLHIIPSNVDLAGAEIELVHLKSRESKLRNLLYPIRGQYDFVIVDCPPSLGLLTLNGLTAADKVLIPVQCDYYAMEGMSQLLYSINLVKKRLNPGLELEGILLTMYDSRVKLSVQVVNEVRNHFKDKVYDTIIPRNAKLGEAPSFGKPITEYAPDSPGAKAYIKVANEVIKNVR